MSLAASTLPDTDPFLHEALLYPDAETYVAGTTRFIRDGLAEDEPVLVAVPQGNVDRIRADLGVDAAGVRFMDMTRAGANPNRIIPLVLRAFLDEHADRRARIIGEPIWPGRAAEEVPLAVQHEALINRAFAGRAASILCPYDSAGLNSSILSFANRTHPLIRQGDDSVPCAGYVDPDMVVASLNHPLRDESTVAAEVDFDRENLVQVRNMVARYASRAGMTKQQIADLRLAVNEVATTTIAHGPGSGVLRIWYEEDRIICEIRRPGQIDDWLAGRMVPSERDPQGRGLLVANNLCDLVETYTDPDSTTTRLHMRY